MVTGWRAVPVISIKILERCLFSYEGKASYICHSRIHISAYCTDFLRDIAVQGCLKITQNPNIVFVATSVRYSNCSSCFSSLSEGKHTRMFRDNLIYWRFSRPKKLLIFCNLISTCTHVLISLRSETSVKISTGQTFLYFLYVSSYVFLL